MTGKGITNTEGFMQQDGTSKVAICGLGGTGKTEIALELAYSMRNKDAECSIFWVPCTNYEHVEHSYMNIASMLGFLDVNAAEAKDKVKAYLSHEKAGKWLLIFDEADDVELLDPDRPLTNFLPQNEQCHFLFTTRNLTLPRILAPTTVVHLPVPNAETAIEMLENSLINKALLDDYDTTVALIQRLAFNPLAIKSAVAYINKSNTKVSEYVKSQLEGERRLTEGFGRYADIQNPVFATWLISFQTIQQLNQLAVDYLLFMACMNPHDIPQSLLPQEIPENKIEAISLLKDFFVIDGRDHSLSLQPPFHHSTRDCVTALA